MVDAEIPHDRENRGIVSGLDGKIETIRRRSFGICTSENSAIGPNAVGQLTPVTALCNTCGATKEARRGDHPPCQACDVAAISMSHGCILLHQDSVEFYRQSK